MKKIIIAMAAIAAAFTMASCNKEQIVEPENNPTEGNCIITASTESNITKTSLYGNDTDGYEVVWSEGDSFKIGDNTFTLIDGAGTTSGKFQGTLPDGDGPFTAYYPATYNGTDWPASQTYTEGNITGSPMTAEVVKGAESLSFKNAGGILRLTLKGTDEIRKITVKADGLDEIALKYDSGVTLNADGIVFHLALPEGEYEGASITIYTKNWDYCTKNLKAGTKLNIVRSEITTASFTVSFPSSDSTDPLAGAFSIADGKQICFSRGNLYYDGSAFKFEAKQCNFHGYDSSSNTWGLFGWSTSATNYGMSTSSDNSTYSGTFYDWGKAIGDGKTWHTLTSDEWQYLFEGRTDADKKYGYGRVYGTYGLIILPDEFTDPMKNNGSGAFVPQISGKDVNGYSLGGNWEAMESAGAVFLPIAGYRGGITIYGGQDNGMYWSSSADGAEKAYYLDFQAGSLKPAYSVDRHFGLSVRLVTNLASCTVKFDMNGHGTAPESLKGIKYDSKITKPADPAASNCIFVGWFKDKDCTTLWNFDTDVVTANITLYAKWVIIPDGALPGLFTINISGKQVLFSKGNLWSDDKGLFHFEDNQCDFCKDEYNKSHISHFMWSENAGVACAVKYEDLSASTRDVFFTNAEETTPNPNFTVNGQTGVWRTLSSGEWKYLIEKNGSVWTTINGINGRIIFCDGYSGSRTGLTEIPVGCLFLPAAGYRNGYTGETIIKQASQFGYYWSASPYNDKRFAYGLYFFSDEVNPSHYDVRDGAQSVRLVTDVTE